MGALRYVYWAVLAILFAPVIFGHTAFVNACSLNDEAATDSGSGGQSRRL
jgi:hypothetical protein